jgi:D-3-phosphoglycerate dehydrogenase
MAKVSLDKEKIKILLLEGLHPSSIEVFQQAGYTNIEYHKGSLAGDELLEAVKDAHFIGIRSRTQLTEEVFNAAKKLIAVGCFCIGTNQVELDAATKRGIPVFNAPFSNTRSVAELVLGKSCCSCAGSRKKMPKPIVVSGRNPPIALSRRAASAWGSSATAISVPS